MSEDVFGQLLLAQYRAGKTPVYEINERDDGYLWATSAQIYFSKYPEWTPQEHAALALVKGRVLDAGCGAGRHALHLQREGFDVTGIDASKGAIAVCRKLGLRNAVVQPIETRGRFRDGAFDTIGLFFNSFGLLQNAAKAKRILREFHRITAPGGQIIADCSPALATDPLHIRYQNANRKRGRLRGRIRMRQRFRNLIGPWHDYLYVTPEEMQALLDGTGWELTRVLKGRKGGRYVAVLAKQSAFT